MIGENQVNISSVEMTEKTDKNINFRFNLIIHDLKNFTKLISQLKQKEYNFKIIRHKNKKLGTKTWEPKIKHVMDCFLIWETDIGLSLIHI